MGIFSQIWEAEFTFLYQSTCNKIIQYMFIRYYSTGLKLKPDADIKNYQPVNFEKMRFWSLLNFRLSIIFSRFLVFMYINRTQSFHFDHFCSGWVHWIVPRNSEKSCVTWQNVRFWWPCPLVTMEHIPNTTICLLDILDIVLILL